MTNGRWTAAEGFLLHLPTRDDGAVAVLRIDYPARGVTPTLA